MTLLLFMARLPDNFILELMSAVVGNVLKTCAVTVMPPAAGRAVYPKWPRASKGKASWPPEGQDCKNYGMLFPRIPMTTVSNLNEKNRPVIGW